ncbi:hypothetical protein AB0939_13285 [Streptomyces sp. NPDC006990]
MRHPLLALAFVVALRRYRWDSIIMPVEHGDRDEWLGSVTPAEAEDSPHR